MPQQVFPGRYLSSSPDGTVVFLIGMRVNRMWKIHRWLPTFLAMVPMLIGLKKYDDRGLLAVHTWFGRTTILLQYWRSMDELLAYSREVEAEHVPGWRAFNRRIGNTGDVGVFHEAYVSHPDEMHVIYRNMPRFGMAKATEHVPANRSETIRSSVRTARTRDMKRAA
jgi:hypothetical protein